MKAANVGVPVRDFRHEEALPKVVEVLQRAHRVLCVMHAYPDGDAVGSTLGLGLALAEAGRDVTLFCATDVPYNLKFLSGMHRVVRELPADASFDATVICDVGASHRVGPGLPPRERQGTVLNVDHHYTNDAFGDVDYVDPEAAAVGVLILRILRAANLPLTRDAAMALHTSVLTDTVSFRYSSTNPEALRASAECLEAGADPWEVSSAIYEQQPLERLHLLRDVLGTLHVSDDGLFASILVTNEAAKASGGRPELTDGFVNFARGIQGVEVAAQLSEPAPGSGEPWRLSLRSRGKVNVAAVASRFGGGGHHNAAGASLTGSLEEVRERVARAVAEELAEVSGRA